jgi:cell wall-associated NlpC family hydrolase
MTLPLNRALRSSIASLTLMVGLSLFANPSHASPKEGLGKAPHASFLHHRHLSKKNRSVLPGPDSLDLAAALAPERAKSWPTRGFDALVQTLSLPLSHPASQKALQMLGTNYKWGGTSEEDGMDCSGFVWRSFKDAMGLVLPRSARDMAKRLDKVLPHELRAGDLVFFNTRGARFSHVGIYLGGAMFAHSPHTGAEARIDNLDHPYWLSAFDGARRAPQGDPLNAEAEPAKYARLQSILPAAPALELDHASAQARFEYKAKERAAMPLASKGISISALSRAPAPIQETFDSTGMAFSLPQSSRRP